MTPSQTYRWTPPSARSGVFDMSRTPQGGEVIARPAAPEVQLALPVSVDQVGEVRRYEVVLPFCPPSKNVYDKWHWTEQRSCKAKWFRWIEKEARAQQMPQGLTRIGLAALIVFPNRNRRDFQNYANALWHFVPDALVKCGVLLDDKAGMIDFPKGLGVGFEYDTTPGRPIAHRSRTVVRIAMQVKP